MLYDVLVVSGFWLWAEMLVLLGILFWCGIGGDEGDARPAFIVIVTMIAFAMFSSVNPFKWVYINPVPSILLLVGYCFAGALWALFKWYVLVSRAANDYASRRDDLMKRYAAYQLDNKTGQTVDYTTWAGWTIKIPKATQSKGVITGWIAYWPFSMFWSVVSDYVFKVFHMVYDVILGSLDGITKRVYGRFTELN